MSDAQTFSLGDFRLRSGHVLQAAKLVYKVYGALNAARSNLVLYPTSYGAQHSDIEWLIQRDSILDPSRYCVVVINMFGNGLSTSPSHLPAGTEFDVTHFDNVTAQERLLREVFQVQELALIYGWSMGAQQAFHWAVMFPERVRCVAALCGTAKTSEHNSVFLRSLEAALTADPTWDGTRFTGVPERGYRAFARIYASWAASQVFYRERRYLELGYSDLEDYLVRGWEANYRRRHPLDLLAMLRTWLRSNVADSAEHRGDLARALASVRARTLVLASSSDLYFTPDDCAADAAQIPGARFVVLTSSWGHRAGNPYQHAPDAHFIRSAVAGLMHNKECL